MCREVPVQCQDIIDGKLDKIQQMIDNIGKEEAKSVENPQAITEKQSTIKDKKSGR